MNNNKKPNKIKKLVFKLLLGISATFVVICAVGFGLELYRIGQGQAFYASLSFDVATPRSTHRPSPTPNVNTLPTEASEELKELPWEPALNFEALCETLPGLTAWIKSEGTVIDYPIVQWTDNNFFLNHLPNGQYHMMGSIFMDYRNSTDFSDKNTLIYGHEMKSGDMFGSLKEYYRDPSYYKDHPLLMIYTPEADYIIELFAGYIVDSAYETPPMSFLNDDDFDKYISNIRRRSVFTSDITVNASDRLVSLCTCDHSTSNGRLIVVGKLVET